MSDTLSSSSFNSSDSTASSPTAPLRSTIDTSLELSINKSGDSPPPPPPSPSSSPLHSSTELGSMHQTTSPLTLGSLLPDSVTQQLDGVRSASPALATPKLLPRDSIDIGVPTAEVQGTHTKSQPFESKVIALAETQSESSNDANTTKVPQSEQQEDEGTPPARRLTTQSQPQSTCTEAGLPPWRQKGKARKLDDLAATLPAPPAFAQSSKAVGSAVGPTSGGTSSGNLRASRGSVWLGAGHSSTSTRRSEADVWRTGHAAARDTPAEVKSSPLTSNQKEAQRVITAAAVARSLAQDGRPTSWSMTAEGHLIAPSGEVHELDPHLWQGEAGQIAATAVEMKPSNDDMDDTFSTYFARDIRTRTRYNQTPEAEPESPLPLDVIQERSPVSDSRGPGPHQLRVIPPGTTRIHKLMNTNTALSSALPPLVLPDKTQRALAAREAAFAEGLAPSTVRPSFSRAASTPQSQQQFHPTYDALASESQRQSEAYLDSIFAKVAGAGPPASLERPSMRVGSRSASDASLRGPLPFTDVNVATARERSSTIGETSQSLRTAAATAAPFVPSRSLSTSSSLADIGWNTSGDSSPLPPPDLSALDNSQLAALYEALARTPSFVGGETPAMRFVQRETLRRSAWQQQQQAELHRSMRDGLYGTAEVEQQQQSSSPSMAALPRLSGATNLPAVPPRSPVASEAGSGNVQFTLSPSIISGDPYSEDWWAQLEAVMPMPQMQSEEQQRIQQQAYVGNGPSPNNRKMGLYKTELCRSWEEKGSCRYGAKCQFAHGPSELRPIQRHAKYKTEICRTFWRTGNCPYARRCCFIHTTMNGQGELVGEDSRTKAPLIARVGVVDKVTPQESSSSLSSADATRKRAGTASSGSEAAVAALREALAKSPSWPEGSKVTQPALGGRARVESSTTPGTVSSGSRTQPVMPDLASSSSNAGRPWQPDSPFGVASSSSLPSPVGSTQSWPRSVLAEDKAKLSDSILRPGSLGRSHDPSPWNTMRSFEYAALPSMRRPDDGGTVTPATRARSNTEAPGVSAAAYNTSLRNMFERMRVSSSPSPFSARQPSPLGAEAQLFDQPPFLGQLPLQQQQQQLLTSSSTTSMSPYRSHGRFSSSDSWSPIAASTSSRWDDALAGWETSSPLTSEFGLGLRFDGDTQETQPASGSTTATTQSPTQTTSNRGLFGAVGAGASAAAKRDRSDSTTSMSAASRSSSPPRLSYVVEDQQLETPLAHESQRNASLEETGKADDDATFGFGAADSNTLHEAKGTFGAGFFFA